MSCILKHKTIDDFVIGDSECLALQELQEEINTYMLQVLARDSNKSETPFLSMQDYFTVTRVTHTERSQVVFLEVMDAVTDRRIPLCNYTQ